MFPNPEMFKAQPTDHVFNSNPQVLISLDNPREPVVVFCKHCVSKILRDTGAYDKLTEKEFEALVDRAINAGIKTVEIANMLTGEDMVEIAFGLKGDSISFILCTMQELVDVLAAARSADGAAIPLPQFGRVKPEQLN